MFLMANESQYGPLIMLILLTIGVFVPWDKVGIMLQPEDSLARFLYGIKAAVIAIICVVIAAALWFVL